MRSGKSCLVTHNSALAAGTNVLLVSLSTPQSTAVAKVIKKSDQTCPSTDPSDLALAGYELSLADGKNNRSSFFIAVFPPPKTSEQEGLVVAEMDQKKQYFRTCTSVDGAHFTVWTGKPLVGKPVWHQYYYLGYDVEANCSKSETIPVKPKD